MSINEKSKIPTISKTWIKQKYWIEQKTSWEMAALRNVKESYIEDLIKKYDLAKKKNGIKAKGKQNYIMPEHEKAKHRVQKNAKEIVVFKGLGNKAIGTYTSINAAANDLGVRREHIRDILNPRKNRNTAKKYRFEYKKYKGEIIVQRRMDLDFSLEFEKVTIGLLVNLPRYPYEERIEHYNKKLKQVWENIELHKGKYNVK